MDASLAAALELDRQLRLRAAPEVHAIAGGFVVRDRALADVYHLNAVLLAGALAPDTGADEIETMAEHWLSDCGHRQVVIDDAPAAEELAPALAERGWDRTRKVFMVLTTDPAQAVADPRAREVSEPELEEVQLANTRIGYPARAFSPDLPAHLVAAQAALRTGTAAKAFGAGDDDGLQSSCTLFLDPEGLGGRVAMVEEVATLPEYRERGLARAAVGAAVRAAGEWEADLIVIPADADDWPQLMYAKLGFAPIGRQVGFTRRPPRGSVSGAV
ncbi:MAG: GNAT family N-acetyltransferase [Solirubrobacteraceae bacterium]